MILLPSWGRKALCQSGRVALGPFGRVELVGDRRRVIVRADHASPPHTPSSAELRGA